jgi:hypothetical protein
MKHLILVLCLTLTVPIALPACTRPVTVSSVPRDVATNGTALLQATIVIQDAIYAAVHAKAIPPEKGIALLDVTEQLGVHGQTVATDLTKLDLLLTAGQPTGDLQTKIVAGLNAMTVLFPSIVTPAAGTKLQDAITQATALVAKIRADVAAGKGAN